jgi:hypothetical protein
MVQGVLTHEMIHMFDYCRNDLDFKNIDHLACTEIRAANLTHCSFMSAWVQGDASPFKIKEAHQVRIIVFRTVRRNKCAIIFLQSGLRENKSISLCSGCKKCYQRRGS